MKLGELKQIISKIVREEISHVIANNPEMIANIIKNEMRSVVSSTISEIYIKKLVTEQSGMRRETTVPDQDDDTLEDDYVPEPLNNDVDGIYGKNSFFKKEGSRQSLSSTLLSEDNPLSALYEGTSPAPKAFTPPVAPLPEFDFKRMNQILKKTTTNGPMQQTPDAKMRELEEKRRRLNVKAE